MAEKTLLQPPTATRRETIPPGTVFGESFRIEDCLGQGGMATVYLAQDSALGRSVALKVLDYEDPDGSLARRFLREARLLASVGHPSIVPVYRYGTDAATGFSYFAMECADRTLRDELESRHTLPERELAAHALEILGALHALHSRDPAVIHRDVKPSNILILPSGRWVLADLGIAKVLDANITRERTRPGVQPGTWEWASPEQRDGCDVTPATDYYALGTILFYALSAGMPSPSGALPVDIAPHVSRRWRPLLRGLLRPDPAERLCFYDTVHATLERIAAPRHRLLPILSGFVLLAAVAIGLFFATRNPQPAISNPTPVTRNPQPVTRDPQPATRDPQPATRHSHPATLPSGTAGETRTITLPGGATMDLVWVPAGSFDMGSEETASTFPSHRERNVHRVTLTKGFWIGRTEVTQAQWNSVMEANPSHWKGADLPVEHVSWIDCRNFCRKLSASTPGLRFALPTEAQWEFAAKGGPLADGHDYAGGDDCGLVAWSGENSGGATHPVGEKEPNELGLFDMSGNVSEWCEDSFAMYPKEDVEDPLSNAPTGYSVCRGGSISDFPENGYSPCLSVARGYLHPISKLDEIGFRVVATDLP